MTGVRRARALAGWVLVAAAAADWAALRRGTLTHDPSLLAGLVGCALLAFGLRIVQLALRVRLGGRARPLAELVLLCGVVVALAAGSANWLLGLRGAAILIEGERVSLRQGQELVQFQAGPLARVDELDLRMRLDRVELTPAGSAGFVPTSRLTFQRAGSAPVALTVDSRTPATIGSLRIFQGAFGFAPRLVVIHEGRVLLDQVVPFYSLPGPRGALAFEGELRLEAHDLLVGGRVNLDTLDDQMRGHATLELSARKGDKALGGGALTPGTFAELPDGYRIGFAGLKKWSEVDLVRRNYSRVMLAGAGLALAGLLALVAVLAAELRRR